jgi:hypothetical protein
MTVGPRFPTETSTATTMPFLRCEELYYFAEGSGHIFKPLRKYLGGRRFQESEVEMTLREWKFRFVLLSNFWTRTNASLFSRNTFKNSDILLAYTRYVESSNDLLFSSCYL